MFQSWMVIDNTTPEKAPPSWTDFAPVLVQLVERVPPPTSDEIKAYCGLCNQDKHLLSIKPCLKSPRLRKIFKLLPSIPWFRDEWRTTAFDAWCSKGMHNVRAKFLMIIIVYNFYVHWADGLCF